jgi:two-component system, LytTR family, response regulator
MIRVLIVDDERLARAELKRLLAAHPDIAIAGEAANAAQALQLIGQLQPDLLLLDVQMPDGSGFDVLSALDSAPDVIFTTAFDHYAMRAFDVNALDYLQKPIQPARLASALARVAQRRGGMPSAPTPATPGKLFIKDGDRCWFVALQDIRLFESEGNYTRVVFGRQRPLMLRSLNQLEQQLDPQRFFRASRRHIVNLDFVDSAAANVAGGLDLQLRDVATSVEVSRRRAAFFRTAMQPARCGSP